MDPQLEGLGPWALGTGAQGLQTWVLGPMTWALGLYLALGPLYVGACSLLYAHLCIVGATYLSN